ncbi:MAG: NAD-dependent epimerase/dehydratase family protein [Cyclobacteriaceae bacterium]
MHKIVLEDSRKIAESLGDLTRKLEGARVLITGHQGFLGVNFLALFHYLNEEVLEKKIQLTCIDNRIVDLEDHSKEFLKDADVRYGDVLEQFPDEAFDYVVHCAGIASPTFYRKYPLETIDVNAISYWHLLQQMDSSKLKGFLYFSTSEIYGDPDPAEVPTREEYRGNVSCTGPRACYDESKRLGETISVSFVQQKGLPIKIVRPFNVYGPFMRLGDKRVIPDFVKFAYEEQAIRMYSDGTPTRAFCYTSDAIEGFTRALLIGEPGKAYNVGNDTQETSMGDLAKMVGEIIGDVEVTMAESPEENYLKDNPQRRCPVLDRARKDLGYEPKVTVREGLQRIIRWYQDTYELKMPVS